MIAEYDDEDGFGGAEAEMRVATGLVFLFVNWLV